MTISCEPADLIDAAKCMDRCVPPGLQLAIQTMLLANIAQDTRSPQELANAARCFFSCIPPGEQLAVQNMLLCAISNL